MPPVVPVLPNARTNATTALLILFRRWNLLKRLESHLKFVTSKLVPTAVNSPSVPSSQLQPSRVYIHLAEDTAGAREVNGDTPEPASFMEFLPRIYEQVILFHSNSQGFPLSKLDVRVLLTQEAAQRVALEGKLERGPNKCFGARIFNERNDGKQFVLEEVAEYESEQDDGLARQTSGLFKQQQGRSGSETKKYKHVVLGGTFDRMHYGHYVMLSQASLLASEKITVGVTDGKMLEKKHLWELIKPVEVRSRNVRNFVEDINGGTPPHCDTVPIYDAFGPAIVYEDIQCLVVSAETLKGGEAVNTERLRRGLAPLDIFTIDVLKPARGGDEKVMGEVKLSSSARRREALGTLLKPTNWAALESKEAEEGVGGSTDSQAERSSPPRPFLIALTGGIASGKSRLCSYVKEQLGDQVEVVSTDKLGHQVQAESAEVREKLRQEFGPTIFTPEGQVDRRALGGIVFADREKLATLGRIMWPAIHGKVEAMISEAKQLGHPKVLLLEIPALIESGWVHRYHQIWCTFVPKEEAITRLIERDGSGAAGGGLGSREVAEAKLASQLSNSERIAASHVVFCTQWSVEETNAQVQKALKMLREEGVLEH